MDNSPFACLAPELRNEIYITTFTETTESTSTKSEHALTRTCRQLSSESLLLSYKHSRFLVSPCEHGESAIQAMHKWLGNLDKQKAAASTHLSIEVSDDQVPELYGMHTNTTSGYSAMEPLDPSAEMLSSLRAACSLLRDAAHHTRAKPSDTFKEIVAGIHAASVSLLAVEFVIKYNRPFFDMFAEASGPELSERCTSDGLDISMLYAGCMVWRKGMQKKIDTLHLCIVYGDDDCIGVFSRRAKKLKELAEAREDLRWV